MHIDDGVLPPEIWASGFAAAGIAVSLAMRRFDEERAPQVAVLTSLFFIASLIHVPVGGTSVHLLLNGVVGIILGWLSIPSVLVALFFQKILLGHGGFTTLGVNTVTMGFGALSSHFLFFALWRGGSSSDLLKKRCWVAAFLATLGGVLVSGGFFLLAMSAGGKPLARVAAVSLVPQLAVSVLDGIVTASAISFLLQVKPELLQPEWPFVFRGKKALAFWAIAAAVGIAPFAPGKEALAHHMEALARLEGSQVVVEASFAEGVPVRLASVTVWEADGEGGNRGKLVAEGMIDDKGRFAFRPERAVGLVIVVEDRIGHRAMVEVAPEKLAGLFLPGRTGERPTSDGDLLARSKQSDFSRLAPEWLRVLVGVFGIGVVSWIVWRISRCRTSRCGAQRGEESHAP